MTAPRERSVRDVTENDLRLSTNAQNTDWRPSGARYTSARHAVDEYLSLQTRLAGQPAIDYGRAMGIDSDPAPENPASLQVHEAVFLERIFERAEQIVAPYRWRCWGLVRVKSASLQIAARREELERRDELKALYDLGELKAWCHHYDRPVPPTAGEGREAWAEQVGVDLERVDREAGGQADRWDLAMADAEIDKETVRRYRDQVDGVIEDQLVDEGALVTWAVRDEDEARHVGGEQ